MKRWGVLAVVGMLLSAGVAAAEQPTVWGTPKTKTATASGNVADQTLWDPEAGQLIVLMGCVFSSSQPADVELEVSNVDVVPPMHLESMGAIPIGYGTFPLYRGATDAVLTYTVTNSNGDVSIVCSGYEEPAGV